MPDRDEREFLDAIVADLDDDTPRLVFADWLDERGGEDDQARAALIRAQCRLEQLPVGDRQRRDLVRRVRDLLNTHADRWTQPLRDGRLGRDWQFRRGFLDAVTMSATQFVGVAERLFRVAPTVRTLRFPDASNEVTRLARCPYLARLASVDLHQMCKCGYCPIERELRDLFKSRHAANLTSLNLAQDRIDAAGARAMASSRHLARLTSLDLSGNPLGADGAEVFASSPHLDRLTSLDLAQTELRTDGARALAGETKLAALSRLVLRGNGIGPAGVRALVASPLAARLAALDLSDNEIGDAGARALVRWPRPERLELLDVRKAGVGEEVAGLLRQRFGKRVRV